LMMVRQNAFSFSELDQTKDSWRSWWFLLLLFLLGIRDFKLKCLIIEEFTCHPWFIPGSYVCKEQHPIERNMHKSEECNSD
jgi:hypothetical protein